MTTSSTFLAGDGDGYEAQMGRWSRRLAPLFIEFAGIGAADRVLDVGSGTGSLTFALAADPRIGSVVGVDYSPIYVEHAKRHATDGRVEFHVGDASALCLPDDGFDHSLSMLVLQFIPEPVRAVREMRRVTRPGGTVAAATWDVRGGLVMNRIVLDTAAAIDVEARKRRGRMMSRPISLPAGLVGAWREAGLENIVQDAITFRMEFASFDDYWMPMDGKDGPIADYLATLDGEAKARLRALVELAYLDGEADGPRSYAATAWVVKGTVPG
ncbi:MAG: class I SAM-dependent methyltransferase [Alphaproteobacteria bacterium]